METDLLLLDRTLNEEEAAEALLAGRSVNVMTPSKSYKYYVCEFVLIVLQKKILPWGTI